MEIFQNLIKHFIFLEFLRCLGQGFRSEGFTGKVFQGDIIRRMKKQYGEGKF